MRSMTDRFAEHAEPRADRAGRIATPRPTDRRGLRSFGALGRDDRAAEKVSRLDDRDVGGAAASHAGQLVVKRNGGIPDGLRPAAAAPALLLALLAACDAGQVAEPEAPLEIVPDSVTLTHLGEQFTFTVRGGAEAGDLRWSSGNTTVFVVDANGTATARRNGVSHVVASNSKSADQALVQVRQVAAALDAFGDGQRGAPALSLLEPVGVTVLDAGGGPVSLALVRFEPDEGSGRVDPGTAVTDSFGLASAVWTLGPRPGRQTLRAVAAEGGASVEIAATALDPDEAVASFEVRSGEDQWAWSGRALAESIMVRALEAGGRAVPGASVRFEPQAGSGRADPEASVSDSAGMASAVWTLGTTPGLQTLAVSTEGGASVEIAATALDPDEAVASIGVHSGENQWALGGHALPEPVAVRVVEEAGRPLWGATVRFEPEAGSGRADPAVSVTDSLGLASALWTLGQEPGAQRLVAAAAGGLTVEFEATAVSDEGVCNRTPVVSAEIARATGAANCAEVTEEMLGGIIGLNLARKGIRWIGSRDFAGLEGLGWLTLDNNRLSELPLGVFAGLSRLRRLDLQSNNLTQLSLDVFKGLSGLKELYLHENRLSELPPGVFAGLSGLRRLDLPSNELTQLSPGVFSGLSSLEALFVAYNRLTELAPGTFADLDALQSLRLNNNELTELPADLFDGVSNLEFLSMRGNRLTALPDGIFSGMSRLGGLSVGENRLTELPPGCFRRRRCYGGSGWTETNWRSCRRGCSRRRRYSSVCSCRGTSSRSCRRASSTESQA